MRKRSFQTGLLLILFASLGLLACDVSTLTSLGAGATKPQVTIQVPLAGAQFREGDDVSVQSTSTDKSGIVRVELSVDGAVVRTDAPPIAQGQTSFSLIQVWKATAGNHTLSVRAFNASGAASDPVLVAITVAPAAAALPSLTAAATLPPLGGTPVNPAILLTPTLSPTGATPAPPTAKPPTRTPSPTTITAPPGVWAVSIRVDPVKPTRGQPVTFYVTFLNTSGSQQTYRWRIRVFEPDKKNSFGDTATVDTPLPQGISEQASQNNWKVTGPGDCITLFARVFWVDFSTKQETEFVKPDQSGGPAAQFQVCP
jgi:hypothetical protein